MKIPWFLILGSLFITGCVSVPDKPKLIDHSISAAITASDRIDGKAVVVESWLKSH
jgi:hypothetical protein